MSDTGITEGIRLSLIKLRSIQLFADKLKNQLEFVDSPSTKRDIGSLVASLNYSERLFKSIYQKAAAYALKKNRILLKREP